MRRLVMMAAAALMGCTVAPVQFERTVNVPGGLLREVFNYTEDELCGGTQMWQGCYDSDAKTAKYRPGSTPQTVKHERAHHAGMVHGPWEWNFWRTEKCAVIIYGYVDYPAGAYVCVDHRGEFIRE